MADPRLSKLGRPEVFDSSFIHAEDYGFSSQLMQKVMVELGKIRTREPLSPDRFIVQAVRALDDLLENINLMSERLHEWYGLHFPELADYVREEKYARMIGEKGGREEILASLDLHLESVGSEVEEKELAVVRSYAVCLMALYKEREELEKYISERMQETAPNITAIVGASLGARLISLAGSLKRLSRLPAGTVQLLGAEKALFLHLRLNKRPPKHGIIFQNPMVHKSPYWQRGSISRSLGAKLAIAAKVDYWKGEFIGDRLNQELEARLKEIAKRYPDPPKRERKAQNARPQGRFRGDQRQRGPPNRDKKRRY